LSETEYSIVIPVRVDQLIYRAIESIPSGAEIIVGFSASPGWFMGGLKERYGERLIYVEANGTGMPVALNVAVQKSTNEKIIVLDSDCYVRSDETITAYLRGLDHAPFVRGVTLVEKNGFWSKIASKGTENLNSKFENNPRLFGPSIAFKKSSFLKYDGYDLKMINGSCDHEFSLRIEKNKERIDFARQAVIIHKPLTFRTDIKSHLGYGKGMAYIDWKHTGNYGLHICLERLYPATLLNKLYSRGLFSVFRSVLLGMIMLSGYLNFKRNHGST
jgi:hypothetical protein